MDYPQEERAITHHAGPVWVLTTANAAGINGLTSLPKHGGARDIKFLESMLNLRDRTPKRTVLLPHSLILTLYKLIFSFLLFRFYLHIRIYPIWFDGNFTFIIFI
jgi:hypothetical protein